MESDQLRGEAGWQLTHDIAAGTTEFHMASYEGLVVGDVLEISSGTPAVEIIVIPRSLQYVLCRRRATCIREVLLSGAWSEGLVNAMVSQMPRQNSRDITALLHHVLKLPCL